MKKAISLLVALLLVIAAVPAAYAGDVDIDVSDGALSTYTIEQMNGKYKTEGRTSIINNELSLDYTASSFEFNANCEGDVSVTFNVKNLIAGEGGGIYLSIYVDGVKQSRSTGFIGNKGSQTLIIATGLAKGEHNFQIFRSTEIERAMFTVQSVTLNGTISEKPADSNLLIEFVGDSITTGYGNLTTGSPTPAASMPVWQDGTATYAFLAAQQLGADISVIARQGIGASVGWQPVSMNVVYPLTRHCYDQSTQWGFEKQTSVVVINLGTNDMNTYSQNGKTLKDVKQGFADLLNIVRSKNPNAAIVWAYGMMLNSADDIIKEVIAEAGGADADYYSVQLPKDNAGGAGHPSSAGHQAAAEVLAEFLQQNVIDIPASPVITITPEKPDSGLYYTEKPEITIAAADDITERIYYRFWEMTAEKPDQAVLYEGSIAEFNAEGNYYLEAYAENSMGVKSEAVQISVRYSTNPPKYTPGDINGDGEVDDTDVMVLARYLAQWDMSEDEYVVDAMDTNGDSSVDDNDVAHLRRYLAYWDGIELH